MFIFRLAVHWSSRWFKIIFDIYIYFQYNRQTRLTSNLRIFDRRFLSFHLITYYYLSFVYWNFIISVKRQKLRTNFFGRLLLRNDTGNDWKISSDVIKPRKISFTLCNWSHWHNFSTQKTELKDDIFEHVCSSVPTRTGKPGKMGRYFPIRERSGNFEQTGKVRENH